MIWCAVVVLMSPFALIIWTPDAFPQSISHSYHTWVGDMVFGSLFAVGLFLVAYRNPAETARLGLSFWVSTTAGLGAIGVAIFPVDPRVAEDCHLVIEKTASTACVSGLTTHGNLAHFGAAVLFFVSIALLCLVVFTREEKAGYKHNDSDRTYTLRPKRFRAAVIYVLCGVGLLYCLYALATDSGGSFPFEGVEVSLFYFWEYVAVLLFAVAWTVKAARKYEPVESGGQEIGPYHMAWVLLKWFVLVKIFRLSEVEDAAADTGDNDGAASASAAPEARGGDTPA
ncbi:MAG: hypothetical protein AAF601_04505 [Pseudomonadota bacterium]